MGVRRLASMLVFLPVAVLVLVFAVANRRPVTLSLDPFNPDAPVIGFEAPLFLVLFAVLTLGVLIGGVSSWLRQGRHRKAAREARDQLSRAETELARQRELHPQLPTPPPF